MQNINKHQEEILLKEVAKGSETAFADLYNNWQGPLSAFIFKVTQSPEMAAEVVQDVFLKIWMSRETLAEIQNFKAYLFVISRNHALNVLKKTMRQIKQLNEFGMQTTNSIETSEEQIEIYSLLDEAIDKLSQRQREIYLMHRQQRLTYVQIAETLGIGRESVKTHLQLAVKSISKYLNEKVVILLLLIQEFK